MRILKVFIFILFVWGLGKTQVLQVTPQPMQEGKHIDSITLRVYLWRDFQPIAPPRGKPLRVKVEVNVPDSVKVTSLEIEKLILIQGNDTVTVEQKELAGLREQLPHGIRVVWRQGPYWPPETTVDVWVWIRMGKALIKKVARNQKIHATF